MCGGREKHTAIGGGDDCLLCCCAVAPSVGAKPPRKMHDNHRSSSDEMLRENFSFRPLQPSKAAIDHFDSIVFAEENYYQVKRCEVNSFNGSAVCAKVH